MSRPICRHNVSACRPRGPRRPRCRGRAAGIFSPLAALLAAAPSSSRSPHSARTAQWASTWSSSSCRTCRPSRGGLHPPSRSAPCNRSPSPCTSAWCCSCPPQRPPRPRPHGRALLGHK
eukprot:4521706-Prymnesium_polylepis.1